MRNLPAFPVALRQTFQCSWLFRFPLVTNVFRLHWNENHILTFTVVRTVLDEKNKQYSVRLKVYFILQFICPLFSGISGNLIYVNDYFTIVYLQAIFLKHTFSSRLIWL